MNEGTPSPDGPLDLELFPRSKWPKRADILMRVARYYGWPIGPDRNSDQLEGLAKSLLPLMKDEGQ